MWRMKNLLAVLIFIFSFALSTIAQHLVVKTGDKGMFVDHTVVAKEGLFSIGRAYNVHPKFLASYNELDMNKGLNVGQVIHVPLTDTNFSQKTNAGTPVYYMVKEKEGLLTVSNANNKVTMQSLRQWNKLSNDKLTPGSKLIVGFLLPPGEAAPVIATVAKDDKKTNDNPPVSKPVAEEKTAEVKKADVAKEVTTPVNDNKPVTPEPARPTKEEATKSTAQAPVTKNDTNGQGYFKGSFEQQVKKMPVSKNETVTGGIFRTASGIQDAKYYLLIDAVSPGTIVRVTNPENNKAVYAKVLGQMDGIRQNAGLNIRISNIAASTLGISDTEKFIVKINY